PPPSSPLLPYPPLFRSQPPQQLARPRARDVDGGDRAGDVEDLDVHLPDGVPPLEPLEHALGSGRRRRDVEAAVGEARDRAVVDEDRKSTRLNSSHVAIS